jgi:hypothetical protein
MGNVAQHLHDEGAALYGGAASIYDPGPGLEVEMGGRSGGVLRITQAGTRILQDRPAGWRLFVTTTVECELVDASGNQIITLLPEQSIELRAWSDTRWMAVGSQSSLQGAFAMASDLPGVRFMDQSGGTTVAQGVINAAALNGFTQDTGDGHDRFRSWQRAPFIPPRWLGISNTWLTGAYGAAGGSAAGQYRQVAGRRVEWGGGRAAPRALSVFHPSTATIGGQSAALVNLDKSGLSDDHGGAMVAIDASDEIWTGSANVFGHWDPASNNLLWFNITGEVSGALEEAAAQALYADIGILQMSNDGVSGVGPGGFSCNDLCIGCCNVGFQCGLSSSGDNGDQLSIGNVVTPFCFTGFKFKNIQSVDHTFHGRYYGIYCPLLFDFERGGKLNCSGTVTLINPGGTLIRVASAQPDEGFYQFNSVTVDTRAGASAKIVHDIGTTGSRNYTFGTIRLSTTVDYKRNFYVRNWTHVKIAELIYARDEMFVFRGGTDGFPAKATIDRLVMNEDDPEDLFAPVGVGDDDSNGAFTLRVLNPETGSGTRLTPFTISRNEAGTVTTEELTWA